MKTKFDKEYPVNASPQLLFQYISTPSGLTEWFADNVNSRGEVYTFIWGDSEEKAKLATKKNDERIKFRWLDEEDNEIDYFFELRIILDELTRSEEHTSELQSRPHLVCRLLLEKKKKINIKYQHIYNRYDLDLEACKD